MRFLRKSAAPAFQSALSILFGLVALATGCPLPQPLVDVSASSPISPPRIIVDDLTHLVQPQGTLVRVPVGCPTPQSFNMQANLRDLNTTEVDTARWFVNYDPTNQDTIRYVEDDIGAPPTSAVDITLRQTAVYLFTPAEWPPEPGTGDGVNSDSPGALHVVELVVSNGFDPAATTYPASSLPNREPLAGFEVQEFRWVFLGVAQSDTVVCQST